jgi:hypothetical protein
MSEAIAKTPSYDALIVIEGVSCVLAAAIVTPAFARHYGTRGGCSNSVLYDSRGMQRKSALHDPAGANRACRWSHRHFRFNPKGKHATQSIKGKNGDISIWAHFDTGPNNLEAPVMPTKGRPSRKGSGSGGR